MTSPTPTPERKCPDARGNKLCTNGKDTYHEYNMRNAGCTFCGAKVSSTPESRLRGMNFDNLFNRVFVAVMARLSGNNFSYLSKDEEWWNSEVAPHLRDMKALLSQERERLVEEIDIEQAAEAVHNAYLDTCKKLGWEVKPTNLVPYAELTEDSKELDRASVRAVVALLKSKN